MKNSHEIPLIKFWRSIILITSHIMYTIQFVIFVERAVQAINYLVGHVSVISKPCKLMAVTLPNDFVTDT